MPDGTATSTASRQPDELTVPVALHAAAEHGARQRRAVARSGPTTLRLGWFRRQRRYDLGPKAIGKERSRHLLPTRNSGFC